jgi:hypothetical protein
VEGHIARLKLIKRQMYGRAKLDLLRVRVLAPSFILAPNYRKNPVIGGRSNQVKYIPIH